MQENDDEASGTIRRIALITYGKSYGVAFCDFVLITAQVGSSIAFAEFITKSFSDVLHVDSVWIACAMAPILIAVCILKSYRKFGIFRHVRKFHFLILLHHGFDFWFRHDGTSLSKDGLCLEKQWRHFYILGLVIFALRLNRVHVDRTILTERVTKQYGRILDYAISIAAIIYIAIATLCYAFLGTLH